MHAHDQTYPCTHTASKHHKTHTKTHTFTHLFFIYILLQFSDTDLLKHKLFFFFFLNIFLGDFFYFFPYYIQHCFICRPSDSTVPTDAGIEPRTVATGALAVRRSNHYARSHPRMLDLIRKLLYRV